MIKRNVFTLAGLATIVLAIMAVFSVHSGELYQQDEIPPFDPDLKPVQMSQEEFDSIKANYTPMPTVEPVIIQVSGMETRGKEIDLPTGDKLQLPNNFYVSDYIMFIECTGPCPVPPFPVISPVGRDDMTMAIDRNGDFWDSIPAKDGRRPEMNQLFKWVLDKYPNKRHIGSDNAEVKR